jgi:hypothetical protein
MGVVIEIFAKYPGGPTRITVTDIRALLSTVQLQYKYSTEEYYYKLRITGTARPDIPWLGTGSCHFP